MNAQGGTTQRRSLRFNSIDEVAADLAAIAAADRAGTLRAVGNWTPGQVLSHVANWINYAYDGFPLKPAPWPIRMILRLRLKSMLAGRMPAGARIPGVEGGTAGADRVTAEEGIRRLQRALQRLASNEPAPHDSPGFGKLTDEQRVLLNLRHAELHLSFLSI